MFKKISLPTSKKETYELLITSLKELISNDDCIMSILANTTSLIKYFLKGVSWVGFYLYVDNRLKLGPFQGLPACTTIEIGRGVCGSAFEKEQTIIVKDVRKHTNHIACDAGTKSEIVVPLKVNNKMYGVLDLDSYQLARFTKTDQYYLEIVCNIVSQILSTLM